MALCLSRATLITVRLDMKAAMLGTVSTNLSIKIVIADSANEDQNCKLIFNNLVFLRKFISVLKFFCLHRKYIYVIFTGSKFRPLRKGRFWLI